MRNLLLLAILFLIPVKVIASDLDVLMARTAMALGDEYAKIATKHQADVASNLIQFPSSITDSADDVPESVKEALLMYEKYKRLAMDEYKIVFCEDNCPEPLKVTGLEMTDNYNFLRRESFTKFTQLSTGSNVNGVIGKYATIYAVNSNFEEHLLGKLSKLVDTQQRLDYEARKMVDTFAKLESSYIDLESEQIIGIDQSILREQNYTLDNQTQISGYEGCIASETIEDDFEKDELIKSLTQVDILQKNIKNHFSKVFSYVYQNPAGEKLFTIKANQGWQDTAVSFQTNDRVLINATGKWNTRGALLNFQNEHLYFPPIEDSRVKMNEAEEEEEEKGWSCCKVKIKLKKILNYALNPLGILQAQKDVIEALLKPGPRALKELADSNKYVIERIKKGLDTSPEGFYFSFSDGASNGISEGTSVSITAKFLGLSRSWGSSSGVSKGSGGSYGFKLTTTALPNAPLGSLIGSFCDTIPDGIICPYFIIGNGMVVNVPSTIGSKKLWLRSNDHATDFTTNSGSVQVQVQKQVAFLNYWEQYTEWFDKDCDSEGYNCGLGSILENIAYVPDPYTVARTTFIKQFPEFPEEVSNIILQELNYIIELLIAAKEVNSKEMSRELHSTKIANCRNQLNLSQEKLANTKEIISSYQRRQQTVRTKEVLLDTSRRYYEGELASLNNIREKNLERIKRYHALTVNAYNYLYLDEFKVGSDPQPYFEGDYFKAQINLMEDLILEITTVNDLLNPNRGFVVYQLSNEELQGLRSPDYRLRKTQIKLDYNDFFCQGFNLENQARVMVEKVGILLDIDPNREHLFFRNPNKRNTQVQLSHGLENRFYDFNGNEKEFWMPAQKRNVAGYSTRILVDENSDYYQLRDARFFERLSFRKTSLASTWQLDMTDPAILMYEANDTTYVNPLLKGAKLVFWFNSAELQGENPINQCLTAPTNIATTVNQTAGIDLSWEFPVGDIDYAKIQQFTIYRSTHSENGFKPVGHVAVNACIQNSDSLNCAYNDELATTGKFYYQVRSGYRQNSSVGYFLNGIPSDVVNITLPK